MALKNPILSNPITVDIPKLNEILDALSKANPTDVDGISTGAMRLYEVSSGKWQWQVYNGSTWASVPFLQHNVDQLDGYHAAITPAANTVAVRDTDGKLKDDITGNAATATTATTLSQTLPVNKGGTGATTSEAARSNLGVPPTSHASTNTTHGVGNATQYGHLKLSDATNNSSGVTGGVAATPAAVKAAKEAADAAQSSADTAQNGANAAMIKASTLATASTPGIVKPGTGMTVDAVGGLNISLNSTVTSTSTTQAATPAAVKQAYDKAVEADDKAGIIRLFNSRLVITTSNAAWTPPVTGWARVTIIGGGGGGGAGGIGYDWRAGKGGKVGGTTTFGTITANPGCGGGGGGAGDNQTYSGAGGGGGGAGQVLVEYVYFSGVTFKVIIGAGGAGGTGDNGENSFGTDGDGTYGGKGGKQYVGGAGGKNSPSIGSGTRGVGGSYGDLNGCGGSGGMTGFGYGGGGGGGGGYSTNFPEYGKDSYGAGMDGGKDGETGNGVAPASGGAGGSGAVIIEYYDPAKEVA